MNTGVGLMCSAGLMIKIDWSGASNGKGWFYYPNRFDVELALTGKKSLSDIDLGKSQLVFAKSLRHYLSQLGLDNWIAKLQKAPTMNPGTLNR